MILKLAILFACISLALVIASYATDWYRITTSGDGADSTLFYWDHSVFSVNGDSVTTTYKDAHLTHVAQTFNTCLSFLTIGAAVLIGFGVVNALRVFLDFKSALFSYIAIFSGIAADVLLCISFFTFINIKQAFSQDDYPTCQDGILDPSYDKWNCDSLIGDSSGDDSTVKWFPGPGWWLLLGAIIFSSLAAGQTLKSGRNNF